jgi:meso-butanediol dehydrogenase/(S,S)-butanediol dehydrogenase/diacetyl reductase
MRTTGNRFEGKTALITGGGTGIGAATARRIAAEGGSVVVTGRRPEPIITLAQEIDGAWIAGDTADPAHVAQAVALCVERFGGLDILIANAATEYVAPVEHVDLDKWREVFAVNLDGPMLAAKAALPEMRRRGGGAIVLVGSIAGLLAVPACGSYMASKAALLGLNRTLAFDYGPEGVRSNLVCPALVPTEMTDRTMEMVGSMNGVSAQDMITRIGNTYPLRRAGTPEEIAAAIAFLASDDASFITGTVMLADGGASIVDVGTLA